LLATAFAKAKRVLYFFCISIVEDIFDWLVVVGCDWLVFFYFFQFFTNFSL
jgi:hypothetical protein